MAKQRERDVARKENPGADDAGVRKVSTAGADRKPSSRNTVGRATAADAEAGLQRFGRWTVIGAEGRRALCRCDCGTIRAISIEAIRSGEAARSCGCMGATRPKQSFASAVAAAEGRGAGRRHKGGGGP